jgi:CBS domain-containing protein
MIPGADTFQRNSRTGTRIALEVPEKWRFEVKVKSIMTSKVECISPEMPVRQAAKIMKTFDIGFLPVLENDRLIGTITDRDIVLRGVCEGKDLETCEAREVMSPDAFWCYEEDSASEVADTMAEKETRRMLILNREKQLVGVVSIGDLAKARGEERKTGETIREIAEAPPARAA